MYRHRKRGFQLTDLPTNIYVFTKVLLLMPCPLDMDDNHDVPQSTVNVALHLLWNMHFPCKNRWPNIIMKCKTMHVAKPPNRSMPQSTSQT